MLVVWMAYAVAIGVVLSGGAMMLEQVARSMGWASRRIWAVGMLAVVVLPTVAWLGLGPGTSPFAAETFREADLLLNAASGHSPGAVLLSGLLSTLWIVASGLMLLMLALHVLRVHRGSREWQPSTMDGVDVWISDDVGPAVVGFLRSRIVLPEWVLRADASARRLILDHEREHLRVGDPRLLLGTMLLVVLMPWNPVLWWMAHRLRRAIEVDCDERVLRHGRWDVRTYGSLLLTVGHWRSRPGYSLAAFSRPRSLLEHRILEMTRRSGGGRWARVGLLGLGSALLLAAAWTIPAPNTLNEWSSSGYWCEGETPTGEHVYDVQWQWS